MKSAETMDETPTLSTGPPSASKPLEVGRLEVGRRYQAFAKAIFDADGEWVEMQIVRDKHGDATNSHAATTRYLIKHFVEITTRKGVVYSRVKK